jgi:Fuc2NAc and GlcNAc transferase
MSALVLFLLGFLPGFLLQRALIVLAWRQRLLAVPNHRSSHTVPTPTSGGIGFVVPVLLWAAAATWMGMPAAAGLLGAGALVAAVGLWDDIRPLSAWLRLLVHATAVGMALLVIPGSAIELSPGGIPIPAWVMATVLMLALVWLVNLYNFMDGIDGLAAAQCLVFCVGAVLIGGGSGGLAQGLPLLAGAVAAFFWHNAPPARIFMGDVGSGFLGLAIGIFAIALANEGALPLVSSLTLLAPFWVDASYTLAVRLATRQRIAEAHRSHAYQKAARRLGQRKVTWGLTGYGALWLIPLAWVAAQRPELSALAIAAAALPVLAVCLYHTAGIPDAEGKRGWTPIRKRQ